MPHRFVVVDDDPDYLDIIQRLLREMGMTDITRFHDPLSMATDIENGAFYDLALIDMTMPEMDGMTLLSRIKKISPELNCIMVTAVNEAQVAVQCLKKGAIDYLVKPINPDTLKISINRVLERKRLLNILHTKEGNGRSTLDNPKPFEAIVTRSRKVLLVMREAELHAASNVPVLITGESGTGKELLARAIHSASPRSKAPFTPINMASLTSSLFEAEFFGHTKGAFTGADQARMGYLEHTNKGTLFLDEIGDLPLELQGKLLRVLQDGEFTRLGSSRSQRVDIRIIAATNENLERMIAEKMFRKDLYYRLRVGWLDLPPLRERKEDIELLIGRFLERYYGGKPNRYVDEEALSLLNGYDYPGNIRELKSIIQSAANLAQAGPITPAHLPDHLRSRKSPPHLLECAPADMRTLAEVEKQHIQRMFSLFQGNKSQTARQLDIGLNTLRRKLREYGIS